MLWPNPQTPTLKLTFGSFRSVGSYMGKMTLVSDVLIENISTKPMPRASFSVHLFDNNRVRIGDGLLVFTDVNPGESIKAQFQCESVGAPATISISAKNSDGTPTSLKTISLDVASEPPGALLQVDGKEQGYTPTTVRLTAGTHQFILQKDGYAVTTSPIGIAQDEASGGSIKITLGGLSTDVVQLRDGSSLTGDVMSLTLDSVVIKVNGKDQKFERNQVSRIYLVERQAPQAPTGPQ